MSIEGRIARLEKKADADKEAISTMFQIIGRQEAMIERLEREIEHLRHELHRRYPATAAVLVKQT